MVRSLLRVHCVGWDLDPAQASNKVLFFFFYIVVCSTCSSSVRGSFVPNTILVFLAASHVFWRFWFQFHFSQTLYFLVEFIAGLWITWWHHFIQETCKKRIHLKDIVGKRRDRESNLLLPGSRLKLGARNFTWVSGWGARNQVFIPSSAAFPSLQAENWIKKSAVGLKLVLQCGMLALLASA